MPANTSRFPAFQKIVDSFLSVGWLIPALLPVVEPLRRTLFSVLLILYILWGLPALYDRRSSIDRPLVCLYLFLVVSFGFGAFVAVDIGDWLHSWQKYGFVGLTLFFTLIALKADQRNHARFFSVLGISLVLTLTVLIVQSLILTHGTQFIVPQVMKERNLPFLLPFALYWLAGLKSLRWRIVPMVVISGAVVAVVFFSLGRSAFLGLLTATIMASILLQWQRMLKLAAILSVLLVLVVSFISLNSQRGFSLASGDDMFTSGRTILWHQAVSYPPKNQLIGVGMGNVRYYDQVITIATHGTKVRHLHNFILDSWYETGFLGLAALLMFLGSMLMRVARRWRSLTIEQRNALSIIISALTAILTAGLFSFSYQSQQFTNYLFFLCGGLWVFTQSVQTDCPAESARL